ncbi:MAG: T9SS type A sorting domain-containing protein [Dysgonamonadaceae bacterium]|jgi:hypothetical protein|nr:T9SS type A sorting domain-containing protein [Dysgonamonadaceae bacterium]
MKHLSTLLIMTVLSAANLLGQPIVLKSANANMATITLKVIGDPQGNGTGFQMLLDSQHRAYEYEGNNAVYNWCQMADYNIPANANLNANVSMDEFRDSYFFSRPVVKDGQESITIPEGMYDFAIWNPDPGWKIVFLCRWPNTDTRVYVNDYTFKAGYEYVFLIETEYYLIPPYNISLMNTVLPVTKNLTANEPVAVRLVNNGSVDISGLKLSYSINGGAQVKETCTTTIHPNDTIIYTFNQKANFSTKGRVYSVEVKADLPEDLLQNDNKVLGYAKHLPLVLPFTANFDEQKELDIYWRIVNKNNDDKRWVYNDFEEDADGGVGYMTVRAPESGNANDYLVTSEAIEFPSAGNYNISFHALPYATESFQILYGDSPDIESMTVLADYPSFDISGKWQLFVRDFDVTTSGSLYFAIRYYSDYKNGTALNFDKLTIKQGSYNGASDIFCRKVILPPSSCDVTEIPVTVRLTNIGTAKINQYSIVYQVNNNMPGTYKIINEPIEPMETKEVQFDDLIDVSAIGSYSIRVICSVPGEQNTTNNELTVSYSHTEAVTSLPFTSDLKTTEGAKYWGTTKDGAWVASTSTGYAAKEENQPLVSNCIHLEEGIYKFSFDCFGGWKIGMVTFNLDYFYVAFGKSNSDMQTWVKLEDYTVAVPDGQKQTFEIKLNIIEEDDYSIAFVSTGLYKLRIYNTSLIKTGDIPAHDISIIDVEMPIGIALKTPFYHVDGEKQFKVTVKNAGKDAGKGVIDLKIEENTVGTVNFDIPAANQKTDVLLNATIPEFQEEGILDLHFEASIQGNADEYPEDNILLVSKIISDSTYVRDTGELQGGLFLPEAGVFGHVYELSKQDFVTSVTIAFVGTGESDAEKFGFIIYPVTNIEQMTIGEAIFEMQAKRAKLGQGESGIFVFDIPNVELNKGLYYFGVQQLDGKSVGMGFSKNNEESKNGGWYLILDGKNQSTLYGSKILWTENPHGGNVYIRPNFGKYGQLSGIGYIPNETAQVSLYPNPASDKLTVNASGAEIEKITITNLSGQTVYQNNIGNAIEYTLNVDNLISGIYFVTLQTATGITTSKLIIK